MGISKLGDVEYANWPLGYEVVLWDLVVLKLVESE